MYESHFHLEQTPFSIAPDPAFLYLSEGHREALAHLTYGFSHGGFVLITGEVGTGKTTLLRNLVNQTPEDLDVAFILNPRLTVRELLETLCDELGVEYPGHGAISVKQYIDALNRHLLATHEAGRDTVVIIDEAQNLSPAVLEQIRLLTNLETDKRKLLRIILLGQPELAELLGRTELRQLAQRITARYHLRGLSREDTYAYVVHRLARAGGNPHLFSRAALRRLYRISGGIPRIINLVADRALLGTYAQGRQRVSAAVVRRAAAEVLGRKPNLGRWVAAGLAATMAAGVASAYFLLPTPFEAMPDAPTRTPTPSLSQRPETPTPKPAEPSQPDATRPDAPEPGPQEATDTTQPAPDIGPAAADAEAAAEPNAEADVDPGDRWPPPVPAEGLARPDMAAFETQRLAYQQLFNRWGAQTDTWNPEVIPCNFAPSADLQCLSRTGSWSDVRRLNLPVVLELWDQASMPYYGAVTRMSERGIWLHLGNREYTATPEDLQDAWFGSFVVLWQMPPDYHGTLKRGDRHPSVRWLRSQLATLGMADTQRGPGAEFDAELQDAVVAFQRQEQLLADGIVGPATWIRLGARLSLPGPRLDTAAADGT